MGDVNKEKVKDALDKFEDEDFVSSKDTMRSEIKKKVNNYLKDKLDVKNDPVDVSDEEEEEEKDEE